jgi:plasmid stability protein
MKKNGYAIRNIPPDQYRELRIMAAEQGISINSLLLQIIESCVKTRWVRQANRPPGRMGGLYDNN